MHTFTLDLIEELRVAGATIRVDQRPRREGRGTIYFEHPEDEIHNTSIDLPVPNDPAERYRKENEVRMRFGCIQAAYTDLP